MEDGHALLPHEDYPEVSGWFCLSKPKSVLEYLGACFSLSQFCTLFLGLSLLACCVAKQEGMVCNFMRTNCFRGQQMAKFSENCAILHGDQPCNQAGYFDFFTKF